MSKYNYASGAIHIDHHKDLSIDVNSVDDAIRLMSAFIPDRKVEDVTPEETTCAKNAHETYCEYIHRENLREQGLYSLDEFEQMIATAAKQPAPQFAKFLKRYQKQGNLDFRGHDKKQIFDSLRNHFPEMREYDYPNFAAAF